MRSERHIDPASARDARRRCDARAALLVLLAVLFVTGWLMSLAVKRWGWSLDFPPVGLTVVGEGHFVRLGVRWDLPSRTWVSREHLRAPGYYGLWERDLLGFSTWRLTQWWYGNTNITIHAAGIRLPWWYVVGQPLVMLIEGPKPWVLRRLREAIRRWRYNRRVQRGLCGGCGYDVRVSPRRCPECGEPVVGGVPASAPPGPPPQLPKSSAVKQAANAPTATAGPLPQAVTGTAPSPGTPPPRG